MRLMPAAAPWPRLFAITSIVCQLGQINESVLEDAELGCLASG